MSVFDTIAYSENRTFERTALAIGKFDGKDGRPQLKIVKTIAPKAHPFLNDTTQYSYLVASTDDKDYPGTAFLTLEIGKYTLTPAAVAIAFEKSDEMVASGEVGADDIAFLQQALIEEAIQSVTDRKIKNGDETTASQEEIDGKLQNLRINLQRNLRNLLALQAWAGHTPGVDGVDFSGFEGTKFSGSTKPNYNQTGTDIKTVFTVSKPKA
jgi:hypothetical protein